jgi:hypothetical protein
VIRKGNRVSSIQSGEALRSLLAKRLRKLGGDQKRKQEFAVIREENRVKGRRD